MYNISVADRQTDTRSHTLAVLTVAYSSCHSRSRLEPHTIRSSSFSSGDRPQTGHIVFLLLYPKLCHDSIA